MTARRRPRWRAAAFSTAGASAGPCATGASACSLSCCRACASTLAGVAPGSLDPTCAGRVRGCCRPAVRAVWLEVGFGGGEHLCAQARAHPEIGLIGCEPFLNGVGAALHADRGGPASAMSGSIADDARAAARRACRGQPRPRLRAVPRSLAQGAPRQAPVRRRARTWTRSPGSWRTAPSCASPATIWAISAGRWRVALAHPAFVWCAERAADWRDRPAGPARHALRGEGPCQGNRPGFPDLPAPGTSLKRA